MCQQQQLLIHSAYELSNGRMNVLSAWIGEQTDRLMEMGKIAYGPTTRVSTSEERTGAEVEAGFQKDASSSSYARIDQINSNIDEESDGRNQE